MTGTTKAPHHTRLSYRRTDGPQESIVLHKFAVGQNVHLSPDARRNTAAGPYRVSRLMPNPGTDLMNPHYRIKSEAEKYERAAVESDLTLSDSLPAYLPDRQDSKRLPE
jgi:hypothetical protein